MGPEWEYRGRGRCAPGCHGHSLVELLLALVILAILAASLSPARAWLDEVSLARSARLGRAHLDRARMAAVARRDRLRVRLSGTGALLLTDARDSVLAVTYVEGNGLLRLDSARLRPRTLRYNARGQASPGSLYLYRHGKGVRLVSNFLGRVRVQRFRP
ncbi:MAG: prepilin-type N-terminal cleavage/methylation domain-containing protein [Gemmatimonadota bacterium]